MNVSAPGDSFQSGTTATVYLRRLQDGAQISLGSLVVDLTGGVALAVAVPSGTPTGNYLLVIEGVGAGGVPRTLLGPVVVGVGGAGAASLPLRLIGGAINAPAAPAVGLLVALGLLAFTVGRPIRFGRRRRIAGLALVALFGMTVDVGATAGVTSRRLAGADRVATAGTIATSTFPTAVIPVLVTAENFPDALAAGSITGALRSPILVTAPGALSPGALSTLTALDARGVVVAGGPDAVSEAVVADLRARGFVVDRLSGGDRYQTAAAVAQARPAGAVGTVPGRGRTAIVATGEGFADALAGGPLAHALHLPMLLTPNNSLSPATASTLSSQGISHVLLLGGTAAVTDSVRSQIEGLGITVERVSGADRSATAAAVATLATTAYGFSRAHVNIARGDLFVDALVGAPHAGSERAPILLTADRDTLHASTAGFLSANQSAITSIDVFGGPGAVSDATVTAARVGAGGS